MPILEPKKATWRKPLFASILIVIGIGMGVMIQRFLSNSKPLDKYLEREDPIDEIISLIQNEYVDSLNKDSLYIDAVNGILSHLDPHTVYIPANQVIQSNEILEGTGKGIGIEYFFLKDSMLITNVAAGSPAQKAGVKIGDRILKVNGKEISGVNIIEDDAVKIFQESDTLSVLLLHTNQVEPSNIKIEKGEITTNSVSASMLLADQKTGYIKIDIFSAQVYDETIMAVETLLKQGMDRLIIDLRENGGGYLEDAVNIADEFIPGKKTLVSINGKREGKYDFNAANKGVFESGRLIILINENSASASEVLAGAVQDWDRGVLIGTNSYGKGLIQEQYDLSDGSAIRITTGRYYTPSGRSIQRPYNKGKEAYENDYYERLKNNNLQANQEGSIFYTLVNHRPIYANGGINPDIIVPSNLKPNSGELEQMLDNFVLDNFVNTYFFSEYKKNHNYLSFESFNKEFIIDNKFMEQMKQYFLKQDAVFTDRIWKNPKDIFYLKVEVKAMIAKLAFGMDAYNQVLVLNDDCVNKALEVIDNDAAYNQILRK